MSGAAGRIPVMVLTGFLGSGKTTLLNRALRDPAMANSAVVINEFGEVGLDHALVASSSDTILVLANGCLCCMVFGDLIGTLDRLYYAREFGEIPHFDHVVIETSGLADPGPVQQAFLSEPTLQARYRGGAIVATVDAINGSDTLDNHAEAVLQIAVADRILITKLDLLDPLSRISLVDRLEGRLRRLNPAAEVVRTGETSAAPVRLLREECCNPTAGPAHARGWLNSTAYLSCDVADDALEPPGLAPYHRHDDSISSFCLVRDEPTSRHALQLLLSALEHNLGPNLLRVKGLISVLEEPERPAVLQGAQHLLHNLTWLDAWPDDDRRTRIVFITKNIPQAELEGMVALLDRVARRTAAARERAEAGRETLQPSG